MRSTEVCMLGSSKPWLTYFTFHYNLSVCVFILMKNKPLIKEDLLSPYSSVVCSKFVVIILHPSISFLLFGVLNKDCVVTLNSSMQYSFKMSSDVTSFVCSRITDLSTLLLFFFEIQQLKNARWEKKKHLTIFYFINGNFSLMFTFVSGLCTIMLA